MGDGVDGGGGKCGQMGRTGSNRARNRVGRGEWRGIGRGDQIGGNRIRDRTRGRMGGSDGGLYEVGGWTRWLVKISQV